MRNVMFLKLCVASLVLLVGSVKGEKTSVVRSMRIDSHGAVKGQAAKQRSGWSVVRKIHARTHSGQQEMKKAGVSPPVNRSSIRDELDTSTLPDGRMFPDEETVAPPCDGLCNSTTSSGILFIGDSPVRRMYIRLLARLAGLTNRKSELLQENRRGLSDLAQKNGVQGSLDGISQLDEYYDAKGDAVFDYNEGGKRIKFMWASLSNGTDLKHVFDKLQKHDPRPLFGFQYVYLGLPTTHMLYHPDFRREPSMACVFGSDFTTELRRVLQQFVSLAEYHFPGRFIFGNGPPITGRDSLTCTPNIQYGCKGGVCDWLQDNNGVGNANRLYKQLFTEISGPSMRLVDQHKILLESERCKNSPKSDFVHFKYPCLDAQLDTIFKNV